MADERVMLIGNFDGVHLGHRAIVERAIERRGTTRGKVIALTFDPHPATRLRPGHAPPRLMSLEVKKRALSQAGVDEVCVIQPTDELLGMSPAAFLKWLVETHRPSALVEGIDFRFGKGRAGDVETLRELGPGLGIEVLVVEPVAVELYDQLVAPVSSSLIRWLIARGRVRDAGRCLGGSFSIAGPVVAGQGRGRTLGVPTANIDLSAQPEQIIPAEGVYACAAVLGDGTPRPAVVSIGRQPTFDDGRLRVEAHLIDFTGDLYNQTMELRFERWSRDQQPFPSADALKAQLQQDIQQARRWLVAPDQATRVVSTPAAPTRYPATP